MIDNFESKCKSCVNSGVRFGPGIGYPCIDCITYTRSSSDDASTWARSRVHFVKAQPKEKKECPECQRWIDRNKVLEERLRKIRKVAK